MKYTISDTDIKNEKIRIKAKSKLNASIRNFKSFDELTLEKRDEIKEEAQKLKDRFVKNNVVGKNYYNIITCITFFDKNSVMRSEEEILALLIETVDPNLRLLKIFMTSNTDFEIEKKSNRLFGFYDPDLIDYEREYARRFYKVNRKVKKLEP